MKKLSLGLTAAIAILSHNALAADPCVAEATKVLAEPGTRTKYGPISDATYFGPNDAAGVPITVDNQCTGSNCRKLYFATTKASPQIPATFTPNEGGNRLTWLIVPQTGSACRTLYVAALKPSDAPAALPSADGVRKPDDSGYPNTFAGGFEQFQKDHASGAFARPALPGSTQGLVEDTTAEALQILGQIVVDRASAQAYTLIKEKLQSLLGCTGSDAKSSAAGTTAWPPVPTFPATCKVLAPLRLEDIATSRDALLGALSADGLSYLKQLSGTMGATDDLATAAVLATVVTPMIVRPKLIADSGRASAVAEAIVSYAASQTPAQAVGDNAKLAIAAAASAMGRCIADSGATPLASCSIATYADTYAGADANTKIAARALATELLTVATLMDANGKPDARRRVLHAVDAIFASACMLQGDHASPVFECPQPPSTLTGATSITTLQSLELMKPVFDAAVEEDSNALVAAIANAIQLAIEARANARGATDADKTAKEDQVHARAFMLLGSLLQYAATYATETDQTAAAQHEQRTKILQSLTQEMTDRSARDGDWILSLGGSLRAVGGIRVGRSAPTIASPLSLPLGIGLDRVPHSGPGLHIEVSAVDLGQYLSYDNNKATVRTPELADALSPGVTIGLGWGKSLPFVTAASASYQPTFKLDSAKSDRGAFTLGLTIGMYVPLLDMN